jgi:hypothetical protein
MAGLKLRRAYAKDGVFLERIWVTTLKPGRNRPPNVYHTTGLAADEIISICAMINEIELEPGTSWPPISDPVNGSRHDSHCLDESGVLLTLDPRNWIADKGYVGNDMITPFKKPPGGELLDWQKEFNTQVNKIRYVIEQVIANFKTWRITHTDYRPVVPLAALVSVGGGCRGRSGCAGRSLGGRVWAACGGRVRWLHRRSRGPRR